MPRISKSLTTTERKQRRLARSKLWEARNRIKRSQARRARELTQSLVLSV